MRLRRSFTHMHTCPMIGEQLRAERGRLGMTQQELADTLGVGRRTVVAWEQDERPIPLSQQSRIDSLFSSRRMNPLSAFLSVDLLAEVIRRLDPATAAREVELLASVIRSLADEASD
jgi:transcriptional regulator with XRE-family HTH domain